jgi:hypothetical protein
MVFGGDLSLVAETELDGVPSQFLELIDANRSLHGAESSVNWRLFSKVWRCACAIG